MGGRKSGEKNLLKPKKSFQNQCCFYSPCYVCQALWLLFLCSSSFAGMKQDVAVYPEAAQTSPKDHSITCQQQPRSHHHELGPISITVAVLLQSCHAYFHVYEMKVSLCCSSLTTRIQPEYCGLASSGALVVLSLLYCFDHVTFCNLICCSVKWDCFWVGINVSDDKSYCMLQFMIYSLCWLSGKGYVLSLPVWKQRCWTWQNIWLSF